jgi:hypothetical protein
MDTGIEAMGGTGLEPAPPDRATRRQRVPGSDRNPLGAAGFALLDATTSDTARHGVTAPWGASGSISGPTGPALPSTAREEICWAAGLFEGEGAVTISRGRRRLSLKMTEEESVRRFHVLIGERGTVYGPYGPYPSDLSVRPSWVWVAEGDDADAVACLFAPVVSRWRRRRIDELFAEALTTSERRA